MCDQSTSIKCMGACLGAKERLPEDGLAAAIRLARTNGGKLQLGNKQLETVPVSGTCAMW